MKRYFKTLGELKGFTSIDLTSKTRKDILDYVDEYKETHGDIEELGLPIKEGVLISKVENITNGIENKVIANGLNNTFQYQYFKIEEVGEELSVLLEVYMHNKDFLGSSVFIGQSAYSFKIGDKDIRKTLKTLDYGYKDNSIDNQLAKSVKHKFDKDDNLKLSDCSYLIMALLYVSLVQKDREVVYRKAKGMTFKSSTKKTKATKTEKVEVLNKDKVMYIINGSESNIKSFRGYTRKTDSWNVIGHWRHYKSGLVKWIEGYKKGNGKAKPKHYKVE